MMENPHEAVREGRDSKAEWLRRLELPGTLLMAGHARAGATQWQCFHSPEAVLAAYQHEEVVPMLEKVDRCIEEKKYVCGQIAYEAAPALDAAYQTKRPDGHFPLVWFGVYSQPLILENLPDLPGCDFYTSRWKPSLSSEEFQNDFQAIRDYLRAGETYQVNHTLRFRSPFVGNAFALFLELYRKQPTPYAAFLNLGAYQICSVSPELFFEYRNGEITCRPMKGTRANHQAGFAPEQIAEKLNLSEKDRAENVMIVDMIRNDLGRLAEDASVVTSDLFAVEHYPTVVQMTSTIRCRARVSFSECIRALFPCSSVTGAPKVRTMEIIGQLEKAPRGVYTGAIGMAHPKNGIRMNVGIRTACVDRKKKQAEYGSGAGIVWDSRCDQEYREIETKARIVTDLAPDFQLLETMRLRNHRYFLLAEHLDRLDRSAKFFGFAMPRAVVLDQLKRFAASLENGRHRVRLLLHRDGEISLTAQPIESLKGVDHWRIRLAPWPVDRENPFLLHKTTRREVYRKIQQQVKDCEEVVLFNQEGQLTEGCFTNLVLRRGGRLVTPARESGLLDGTLRRMLIRRGKIEERLLYFDDLKNADAVWMINSVRGFRPARWVED
jgi:para-aminobenzoate synthetase/4-amino-4-deoxychorismate lyase